MKKESMVLTEEEKALVEAKRLEAKAEEQKAIVGMHKRIADEKVEMEEFKTQAKLQNASAREYHAKLNKLFPDTYVLATKACEKEFEVSDYISSSSREERGVAKDNPVRSSVWWSETLSYQELFIKYESKSLPSLSSSPITIQVEEHTTWLSGYSARRKSHGYKMIVKGIGYDKERALKNPATAHKNITEYVSKCKRVASDRSREQRAQDMLEELIKDKYYHANVNTDIIGKRIHNKWIETKIVKALFSNGLEVYFTGWLNAKDKLEVRTKKVDTTALDQELMIKALISIPKKKEAK